MATTGVTSALGFLYWALAARLFSQRAVGYGSRCSVSYDTGWAPSACSALALCLWANSPDVGLEAGLVSAGVLVFSLGSMLLGLGFALVAPLVSARFAHITGPPDQAALFAAGVMVTGASLVFDQATIGLMRGGLQLSRKCRICGCKNPGSADCRYHTARPLRSRNNRLVGTWYNGFASSL